MAWEVPGASAVRFNKGDMVATVFPGLLTVSLLAAEGLPTIWVRKHYLLLEGIYCSTESARLKDNFSGEVQLYRYLLFLRVFT